MSDSPYSELSLQNIGGGAAVELFDRELESVLKNIQDVETDPKAKRTIVLKIEIEPNDSRGECVINTSASSKLAPAKSNGSTMHVVRDGAKIRAFHFDPTQGNLFDPDAARERDVQGVPATGGES